MTVDTNEADAVDAQRGMLEFLLVNHPLDCPICDRAGECPLQDQTYKHGPGTSRYVEPKRTYEKALEISDLVVLDRERCVLCWRCVRFADEIAGDRFIQLVDRGPGTQILTFSDQPFDSYFSGNTIQICPVGALTAKPYRFVSRPWDLTTAPSVCGYCAVGCPITNEERAQKLVRCQALPNENVNDFWICDKGRFGYHYVSSSDRLTNPLVRTESDEFDNASWGRATACVADALRAAESDKVAVLAGGHLTTEDAFAIGRLAREVVKTPHIDSRIQDAGAPYELAVEPTGVAGSSATLNDLEDATSIVWVGPDPKETLPVLFLRIRKAVCDNDAQLVVVGPRRISLDEIATKVVRCTPGGEANAVRSLIGGSDEFATKFLGDPLVLCWGPASPGRDEHDVFTSVVDVARDRSAKILVCPPHAGSQGLIDMGVHPALEAGYKTVDTPGKDARAILEAAAAGEIDVLLLFGVDPITDFPDAALARQALETVPFVAVVELFATETVALADAVFPSAAYAEREATYTNLERRLQKLEPLLQSPGSSREPWRVCAEIAEALGAEWTWHSFDDVWVDIKKSVATHADVDELALIQEEPTPAAQYQSGFEPGPASAHALVAGPGGQYPKGYRSGAPFQSGANWPLSWELRAFEAKQRPGLIPNSPTAAEDGGVPPPSEFRRSGAGARPAPVRGLSERTEGAPTPAGGGPEREFVLYSGRLIYDEGAMVRRSAALHGLARPPFIEMNEADAADLGLAPGDEASVAGAGYTTRLPVVVGDIAKGAVFVPYDQPGLAANRLMSGVDPTVTVSRVQ